MDVKRTGELIARLRKEQGLTQRQLAEKLNISDRTVSKWERGAGFPDVALLGPLADVLGISVVALLRGEPDVGEDREISTRDAIAVIYRQTKQRLLKNIVTILAELCLAAFWIWFVWAMLEYNGAFLKEVSLTAPAVVYQNGEVVEETVITMEGERDRDSFVGTFSIGYVERTTREGVKALVRMGEVDRYPNLRFMAYGDTWDCGIRHQIYISDDLTRLALELEDGTIIATDDWLMELKALGRYYPVDF